MSNEQTRPKSRPRALFLDLTSPSLSSYAVPKNTGPIIRDQDPGSFEDALCRSAVETGLPIVALRQPVNQAPQALADASEAQVILTEPGQEIEAYDALQARAGLQAGDVLLISDAHQSALATAGGQHCSLGNALPVLRHLSITARTAAFARADGTAEQLAHTVLLPLDLELGSMEDPHALLTHGRLIFDTVLLLKEFVPTEGFKAKALEKLIADYAPIVYALGEDNDPAHVVLSDVLGRLHQAGARQIVMVSATGETRNTKGDLQRLIEAHGFECHICAWNSLPQ
ncbi:hypothetical protein [uncultured Roseobacter sp.]|uniref:hypothetical protein n=1 Tax=uncultured Roseobacter sp. TaxID=114847 RepID=UPI002604A975|nr:hypothetical protein [uncultured Roseobacter sp.]